MSPTAEKDLLFGCARYPLRSFSSHDLAALLQAQLNWNYVLMTAGSHGLAPLLFRVLTEYGVHDTVPPPVQEKLKTAYLASLMRNQWLYGELAAFLKPAAAQDVPVILLKGAALCLTLYEDMALRPFGDLDILVRQHDVNAGRRILEDLDFDVIPGIYFPVSDEDNSRLGCEWSYHRDGAVIELHWNLINSLEPFRVDIDLFWDGAQEVSVAGNRALVMTPGTQLLHLCLHQFKHRWEHLRDLLDISLLIERQGRAIDWERLAATANAQGLGRCVYYSISLCQQVLDLDASQMGLERFLGRSRPTLIARDMQELIAAEILSERLPRRLWEVLMVDGARAKLSRILLILAHPFPRTDHGHPGRERETSLRGKMMAPVRSLYFHRDILVKAPRYLLRRAGAALRKR